MSVSSGACLPDGRKPDELKVSDLKKELELRGLSRSGVKKDLCARLSDALDRDNAVLISKSNTRELEAQTNANLPQIANSTEDTVELDTTLSEEEVTDISTTTVIFVDQSNADEKSQEMLDQSQKDSLNDSVASTTELDIPKPLEQQQTTSEVTTNTHEMCNNDKLTEAIEPKLAVDVPNRRRQWGSRANANNTNNSNTSLSSESLEKLLPTPALRVKTPSVPQPQDSVTAIESLSVQEKPPVVETPAESEQQIDKTNGASLSRELEHEIDAVVVNVDADENIAGESEAVYDSRTVHLPNDVDVRLNTNIHENGQTELTIPQLSSSSGDVGVEDLKKTSLTKRKGPKEIKTIGYMVDSPERVEPSQPSKHAQTDIVYIRFLVRPFTAEQLRQMITTNYGTVVDLWLDKIKSTSLIRMQSSEEAAKCREGLDGSRWPSMNPRVLRCEFGNNELFEWMKLNGDSSDIQPPKHLFGDTPEGDISAPKSKISDESGDHDLKSSADLRYKLGRVARESDNHLTTIPKQSAGSKEAAIPEIKAKNEEPAKLLNDLFRKTATTPSIYWLPLTPEQVAEKEANKKRCPHLKQTTDKSPTRPAVEPERRKSRSPFANRLSSPARSKTSSKAEHIDRDTTKQKLGSSKSTTAEVDTKSSSNKVPTSGSTSECRHSTKPKEARSDVKDSANHQSDKLGKTETNTKPSVSAKPDSCHRAKERSPSKGVHKRKLSGTDNNDRDVLPTSKYPRKSPTGDPTSKRSFSPSRKHYTESSSRQPRRRRRSSSSRSPSPIVSRAGYKASRYDDDRSYNRTESSSYSRSRRRSHSGRRDRSPSNYRYRSGR